VHARGPQLLRDERFLPRGSFELVLMDCALFVIQRRVKTRSLSRDGCIVHTTSIQRLLNSHLLR
jgi:hypothetical protein